MSEESGPLWRNHDFVLLWGGQMASYFGTKVSSLALPLLVLAITNSPAQAGLIASARMLPYLIVGLPAGALVDRWDRRHVMIACDTIRCLALGSVPLAWMLGRLTLTQLYIVALLQGSAFVFFNVAEIAALPRVVSPDDLPHATALDSTAGSIASLAGPGLGGAIIGLARSTALGAVLAYLFDSLTYLVSVISLGFLRTPLQEKRDTAKPDAAHLYAEMLEGLRFVWLDGRLRTLALLMAALGFLYAPVSLAMIVLARDHMHAGPAAIGLVFSVAAMGGLLGSFVAPWLKTRMHAGTLLIGSVALQALATIPVALAPTPVLLAVAWALVFACDPIFYMASASFRYAVTPDALQSRVGSVFRLLSYGAEPLGTALGGLVLVAVGPRVEIWGVAMAVGVCAMTAFFTPLRRL